MDIIIAENAGFCFGVKRALELATRAAEDGSREVCTLGALIHNPQEVARLEAQGVHRVESLEEVPSGAVILSAHGVDPAVEAEAKVRGLEVIDATCPFVRRAQEHIRTLAAEGYSVVILGDPTHREVAGLAAHAQGEATIVTSVAEAAALPFGSKYGLVVQTTQRPETLREVAGMLAERSRELRVFNTICEATVNRQESARDLAQRVEVMLVVGGRNSANTARLREICEATGTPTHHIETAAELDPSWFADARRVGITAGASTPDWVVAEVEARVRELAG